MVEIRYRFTMESLNLDELVHLFEVNQMKGRTRNKLGRAFKNSQVVCFAFDGDRLVGVGRAVTDGEYHAGIYDIAVLPEYQMKGIGRAIMEGISAQLNVWRIILVADGDQKDFYRKFGFEEFGNVMACFNPEFLYNE